MNSNINNIVFFDGYCGLCNKLVDFLMTRNNNNKFYFASLQGETAAKLIPNLNINSIDTVWFFKNNRLYKESRAILEIMRQLGRLYQLLYIFIIIPPVFRNAIYRWCSKHRYSIFGKSDQCRIPNEKENNFLS